MEVKIKEGEMRMICKNADNCSGCNHHFPHDKKVYLGLVRQESNTEGGEMRRLLYALAKVFLTRSHGKNRLVTYKGDEWLELSLYKRGMIGILRDGRVI